MRRFAMRKCRWAGIEGVANVDADTLGDKSRMALALLRSPDPDDRALEELELHFESSGSYDPGKYFGAPENCYPEEYDEERELTEAVLLLDKGEVKLADTIVSILASDPVVLKAVDRVELEPPEPDYDSVADYERDRRMGL